MKNKIFLLGLFLILSISLGLILSTNNFAKAEETADNNLESLLADYYGDGTYKKDTQIFIDKEKVASEIYTYFHDKVAILERTTYYSKDALWMSRDNGEYSYYGTSYDGNTQNGVTNATAKYPLVTPDGAKKVLSGTNKNSMEEYYVTLDDFINGTHTSAHTNDETIVLNKEWSVDDNGVYSNVTEGVLDGFRLFTAPLWLGKTENNANYIIYTKATIQEVDSKLVMKLWVSSGDSGKLVDGVETDVEGNLLFSEAVVSKKQADGLLQGKSENLQAGLGTDFEGYSQETHPEIYEETGFNFTSKKVGSATYIKDNPNLPYGTNIVKNGEQNVHGIWFADNNGNNAVALQAGYNDMRLVEEDGNTVVKVSKGNGTLTRVGMTVNDELRKPGTYVATIKVKAGSDANEVGKILFKLYDSSNIFSSGNKTDGFYFRGTSDAAPSEAIVKGEWITLSVEFTISKEISYTNDLCATLVVYNKYTSEDSYVLLDDFEVYRVEDYGTDFEGFDTDTHSSLFASGNMSQGWKKDGNDNSPFGIVYGWLGVKLFHEENGNNALKVSGTKDAIRAGIDINDILANPGVYKISFKVKLGPDADKIGDIYIKYHDKSLLKDDKLAPDKFEGSKFYLKNGTEDVGLSKDEWVTLETTIVITDKIEFPTDLCLLLMIYTYGSETTGTDAHAGNYVLVDDFYIEGYAFQ